jgi:L-threonylcarbamoyladenylate synthase
MHIIKLEGAADQGLYAESSSVLQQSGLVCLPCHGKYRLLASLNDVDAVTHLFQSKRRVGKSPALVFVTNEEMLRTVAADVPPIAKRLMDAFWPGPLTILFEAHPNLPRKVVKQLTRANGHIGVRIPDDPTVFAVVEAFGGPVLVSSANREKKAGDTSPAQVRKNFVHRVDLFIDAGDLKPETPSTCVNIDSGAPKVTRPGAISEDRLLAV